MVLFFVATTVMAQRIDTAKRFTPADSINKIAAPIADKKKVDSVLKNHSPRTAAIRSAISAWPRADLQ
jgi:hypothetical protein